MCLILMGDPKTLQKGVDGLVHLPPERGVGNSNRRMRSAPSPCGALSIFVLGKQ